MVTAVLEGREIYYDGENETWRYADDDAPITEDKFKTMCRAILGNINDEVAHYMNCGRYDLIPGMQEAEKIIRMTYMNVTREDD